MNLLEMLKDQIGDQLAKNASNFLGESQDNVGTALDGIFPSLLGKVADMAQDKSGAESIFDLVNGTDDSILDNIGGLFGGGADAVNGVLGSGSGIVNAVFGGGLGSIIEKVAGLSGLKKSSSSSLVKMAAPFLFGIVKRAVMKKGLDAVGLGSLLGQQRSFVDKLLPAGLGSVLGLGKNLVGGASNLAGKAVGGAGDLAGKAVGGAGKVVGGAANVAGNVGNAAVKTGGGLMKWIIPALLALLALGFFGFKTGCGAVDNMADKTADMTKGAVAKTGELAGDAVKGAGEMAGDAVKGAGGLLSGAFGKVNEAAKAALDKVEFAAGSAGDQMIKFIDGGFKGNGTFRIKNGNFASGSDVLTAETKGELDNLTSVLNAYPGVKLSVDGYTDNTGNADKNKTLSEMRAKSVKAYLIQKGIKGNRIVAQGFGDANPVASNDTKEGQAENRRIELKVIK